MEINQKGGAPFPILRRNGADRMPPVIDASKCIGCGTCAQICCMDVYGPVRPGATAEPLYPEECWHCRACVMDCPAGAIQLRYPLPMTMLYRKSPNAGGETHA